MESAAKESLMNFLTTQNLSTATMPDFQAILKSDQLPQSLRNLTAEHVNLLIKVCVMGAQWGGTCFSFCF